MIQGKNIIGIDASRIRSGGAVAHLLGILNAGDPRVSGIDRVVLWCNRRLSQRLPKKEWLTVCAPRALEGSLLSQILWQKFSLHKELRKHSCRLLFNLDGATFCRFTPCISLSQDMLAYEPGMLERYPLSFAKLRLFGILYLQNRAFVRSSGVVFLTKYAAKMVQRKCGVLSDIAIIPHGVDEKFYGRPAMTERDEDAFGRAAVRCIYVSNADIYKNQLTVVEAIRVLRDRGIDATLTLVGGGSGPVQTGIEKLLNCAEYSFLEQLPFVPSDALPRLIQNSDVYVFASSCENMPVTLLEGMASGVPIACSKSGPMPEVIESAGVFFDPLDPHSIADAIEELVRDPMRARELADDAVELSKRYTWEETARRTWQYISAHIV